VKDFQTVTLRQGIHPVLLTDNNYFAKGSVKIDMGRAVEAIAQIENTGKNPIQETTSRMYFWMTNSPLSTKKKKRCRGCWSPLHPLPFRLVALVYLG